MNGVSAMLDMQVVNALGLALLHFIWQGLLLWLLCALVLRLLREHSPKLRYLVALTTLVAMALAPVATFMWLRGADPAAVAATVYQVADSSVAVVVAGSASWWPQLLQWVVALWLAGLVVFGARLLSNGRYLMQLKRQADYSAMSAWQPRIEALSASMGLAVGRVRVALSHRIASPLVAGLVRPVILMPAAVMSRLPSEQIEAILAHELAHVRRHDHWVNLLQVLIETLLFYHPAVAWVSGRIRAERELCADDLALSTLSHPLVYARALASLEEQRAELVGLVVGATGGDFSHRIRRLFGRRARRQKGGVGLLMALVLMAAGGAGMGVFLTEWGRDPAAAPTPHRAQLPAGAETGPSLEPASAPIPVEAPEPAVEPVPVPRDGPGQIVSSPAPNPDIPEAPAEIVPADAQSTPSAASPAPAPGNRPVAEPPAPPRPVVSEGIAAVADQVDAPDSGRPVSGQPEAPSAEELIVTGGKRLQAPGPEYPRYLLRRALAGEVTLAYTVDRTGRTRDLAVVGADPPLEPFEEAARAALENWRFEPFRVDGRPVERRLQVTFEFDPGEIRCVSTGTRLRRC